LGHEQHEQTSLRIVINTPAELVLIHRPRVLPLLLATFVVAVTARAIAQIESMTISDLIGTVLGVSTGGIFFFLVSRRGEFRFDAASGELHWERWDFMSRVNGTTKLASIEGVDIETNRHGEGEADRVVLLTKEGRIPLTWHYSGIDPHRQTVEAIRIWMHEHGFGEPVA
jgi:hypothetical protein